MNARLKLVHLLACLVSASGMPAAALATGFGRSTLENGCVSSAYLARANSTATGSSSQAAPDACSEGTATFAGFFEFKPDGIDRGLDIGAQGSKGAGPVRWISNSNGNWHQAASWVGGVVPVDGDSVGFGLGENDLQLETADTDNAGNGVNLPNSTLQIERKMTFSDASGGGDPLLADDGMTFNEIRANGAGGSPTVFNVPVTATTISSNRHGAVFNREITVLAILAQSQHQDRWQINASATAPLTFVLIDEQRGPDGGNIDGSFSINSDLDIEKLDQVWGRLVVGAESVVNVEDYLYVQYVNQAENNSINPITLDGDLNVVTFTVFDRALGSSSLLETGTYGRTGNGRSNFEVDFISGDGLLTVIGAPEIFVDGFEPVIPPAERAP